MLDFLVITAHPDDETAVAGLLLKAKLAGYKTGLICLTQGESGGFAAKETRKAEFEKAIELLQLDYYRHLDFPDSGVEFSLEGVSSLIPLLRETEAKTVLTIHADDYHPDHKAVSQLVDKAIFIAGLKKHSTNSKTWHPGQVLYFSLDPRTNSRRPDIILDITPVYEKKRKVLEAYGSQQVTQMVLSWSQYLGNLGGFTYGEGFYIKQALRLEDAGALLNHSKTGR